MESTSPIAIEVQRLLRPTLCGHGKHHFIIDRRFHGGVHMKCKWTMCQKRKTIARAVLKALVAR